MKNIIVGTAGHIDHGKTTLVKALTGIDTDRLKEEKARGISIDLGFANLTTAAGNRIAFIDVPGHERFVRNMLAGVSGIDLVLLIVAADEAIKPQTREHFDICRLLGIRQGIVVITKCDLVERDWLELVRMELEDFVRGSFLEGAPILGVSAREGEGLKELTAAIEALAAKMEDRSAKRIFRLPIDRSFVLKGHGTVVTGTVWEGTVSVEQELHLLPGETAVRVRGLHVHGKTVKQALPGQRAALNLAGIEASAIARGQVLTVPGKLAAVSRIDTTLELLPGAPALRDSARVHLHTGTMEVEAEARLLTGKRTLEAGQRAHVRFALAKEILTLPGDRFIIRRFSPVETIGGGEVLELHPGTQRLRRVGASARLATLEGKTIAQKLLQLEAGAPNGIRIADATALWGATDADLPAPLLRIGDTLISEARLRTIGGEILEQVRAYHKAKPLEPGLAREIVRQKHLAGLPNQALEAIQRFTPALKAEGEFLRLDSHRVQLAGAEDAAASKMEKLFLEAGLSVPATDAVLAQSGLPPLAAKNVLQVLLKANRLKRVGPDLVFHVAPLEQLIVLLQPRKGQRFNVADFKDWTGVSRKYAIPLLEYFDRERLTRRDGDFRIIL